MDNSVFGPTIIDKIERICRKFASASDMYISLYDSNCNVVKDFTCSEEEKEILNKYASQDVVNELYSRIAFDEVEDQVIENTKDACVKLGVSAIRIGTRCELMYVTIGVIAEEITENGDYDKLLRRTSFKRFLDGIDVIRENTTDRLIDLIMLNHSMEEKAVSKESSTDLEESLKRVSAMTELLKFLETEKPIESVMNDFLANCGGYLNASMAYVIKNKRDDSTKMDIAAQWYAKGVEIVYEKTLSQTKFEFLEGNKPIILSGNSLDLGAKLAEWEYIPVNAVIAMPVLVNRLTNEVEMYVVFFETKKKRNWTIDELQFVADASKVFQSILDKRIQKNSIASSYVSLEGILENVGCAVVVHDDVNKEVLYENQLMKKLFSKEKINPQMDEILWDDSISEREIEFYDFTTGYYYEILHSHISWVNGQPVSLYAIYDVTDKKNYQKRIEQQAYTDFLTGLFNRMCCERDLARVIDESKKMDKTGAVLYLDLDNFKYFNDALGHQYGDVLLKEISADLRRIKGLEESCYRMGGDEFVIILLPRVYEEYDRVIDEIQKIFRRPFYLKDGEYFCTMSMGIVTFPDEGDSVADLVQKADVAMYEAKKSGKNKISRYVSGSTSLATERLGMEMNMRAATQKGCEEFVVYYQPIIDIKKEGSPCVGAEALVRWDSKELGFVSPGEFIPLAEHLGLINPIGDHVLEEACKTCKFWNENGHPEFKVNVNLSVVQLIQDNIVERIKETVENTGINPHNLTLEVTESLAIDDVERMKSIMASIRDMGIRIALDDFGTGYSALNHIRELPLDVIKVDQSFVKELVEDDYHKSFIKMVAELAGAIGVNICVEGIETEAQYKVLEGMNISMIQGYYFSRPIPRDDFMNKYMK